MFGMGTGVSSCLWSPTKPGAGFRRRPVNVRELKLCFGAERDEARPPVRCLRVRSPVGRNPVGATKSSTVSTASLKVFLPLHVRPINLVIFQGSSSVLRRNATLISRRASCLDAFSGYLCPT